VKKLVLIALVSASTLFAADQKALPWEKNRLQIGLSLYRANCVVCHDIDRPQSQTKKFGPSFYQLFRQSKMPISGVPPSRAFIRTVIQAGFPPIMPSFADQLKDSEIDTLLDFLQSK
jgi:mono/diheme cytochrome c family protein